MIRINLPADEVINPSYLDNLVARNRWLVLMGGAGSGKSYFAAQKILLRALSERGHKIAVFRKVARTQRLSCFSLMLDILGAWKLMPLVKVNRSDLTITVKHNGNEIHFLGLDDPEKLKSITGITSTWVEEATELTQGDLEQINLRIRGVSAHYKQHILTFNPISVRHWLKQWFWDNRQPDQDVCIHTTTYRDNARYLDAEYIKELELLRQRDPALGRIYADGQWGELTGLIYGEWPMIDQMPKELDEIIYGLDFGYNNPMALVKIGIRDNVFHVEQMIYQSGYTTADLVKRLGPVGRHRPIYADSSEPDRIEEIKRARYNVKPATKGQGSVQAGISTVKSCDVRLVSGSVEIAKELQTYKWAEDKDGNQLDEPVKYADHAMDAIRYALHSHLVMTKQIPPFVSRKAIGV